MIDRFAWIEQRRAGLELARILDETAGREKISGVRAVASRSGALELYARGQLAVDEALVEERPALEPSAGITDRVLAALAEPTSPRPRRHRRAFGAAILLALAGTVLYIAASARSAPAPEAHDTAAVALRGAVVEFQTRARRAVASIGESLDATLDSVDEVVRAETNALSSDVRWAVTRIVDGLAGTALGNMSS